MDLETKTARARELLGGLLFEHAPAAVRVAWTGGKDSTLALHLWLGVLAEAGLGSALALSLDTGVKFPEVMAFRDRLAAEWGVDVAVVRPGLDPADYPVARDKAACCRDLKVEPLKRAVRELGTAALITGLRRDEHPSRADRPALEQRDDPAYLMVHPVIEFTEMDVWAYVTQHNLPYCSLYGLGYRSLGCVPCTEPSALGHERSGRARDKEDLLDQLHGLGYF